MMRHGACTWLLSRHSPRSSRRCCNGGTARTNLREALASSEHTDARRLKLFGKRISGHGPILYGWLIGRDIEPERRRCEGAPDLCVCPIVVPKRCVGVHRGPDSVAVGCECGREQHLSAAVGGTRAPRCGKLAAHRVEAIEQLRVGEGGHASRLENLSRKPMLERRSRSDLER
jgi:hypothetical protein